MTLPFHKKIVSELLEEDGNSLRKKDTIMCFLGLLIIAPGLNLTTVIANLIKVYCDAKGVVFVLNLSSNDQELIIEELVDAGVPFKFLPKRINTEYTASERWD
jgi:hypothetical protein